MRDRVKNRIDDVLGMICEDRIVTSYPTSATLLLEYMDNCRLVSYRYLADRNHVSMEEIIRFMGSADGNTTYKRSRNHYLIAVNGNRKPERVNWTTAHEIGHIIAGHFLETGSSRLPVNRCMEEEADYFAANFLAPLHEICLHRVRDERDLAEKFFLSRTAAHWRWQEYQASGFAPRRRRVKPFYPVNIEADENWTG